jgi:hypothetical protein
MSDLSHINSASQAELRKNLSNTGIPCELVQEPTVVPGCYKRYYLSEYGYEPEANALEAVINDCERSLLRIAEIELEAERSSKRNNPFSELKYQLSIARSAAVEQLKEL